MENSLAMLSRKWQTASIAAVDSSRCDASRARASLQREKWEIWGQEAVKKSGDGVRS